MKRTRLLRIVKAQSVETRFSKEQMIWKDSSTTLSEFNSSNANVIQQMRVYN